MMLRDVAVRTAARDMCVMSCGTAYYPYMCTFFYLGAHARGHREKRLRRQIRHGPPKEEERSHKAQGPATTHKDRTQMMMAPSNLMGYRRRWVRVEEEESGGDAERGGTVRCAD